MNTLLNPPDGVHAALLVPAGSPHPWPFDPWDWVSHRVEGSILELGVRFSGGCREHRFALLLDPAFRESHPVQVGARLAHDDADDPCDAVVDGTLRFDLEPLRERYVAGYGPGPATLVIVLAGREIRYDF